MIVLARPRVKGSEDMVLEDDDVTEDYLEKSFTELLGDTSTPATLRRSMSARVRRRERERSPEQFGLMFRTLPPLTSGYLNSSLSVPSQTMPSQLPPTDLHNKKKMTKERVLDKKSAVVADIEDNENEKDLGDTTDLLNVTHVMKMDPIDNTLTLSPVQKDRGHRAPEQSKHEECKEDSEEDDDEEDVEDEEEEDEEDEDEQEEGDEEDEEEQEGDEEKNEEKTEKQEDQPTEKEKEDMKEETIPDGLIKDSQEKGNTSSQEEKSQSDDGVRDGRSKSLFGTNGKISLFRRRFSTKDRGPEEKGEALSDSNRADRSSADGPSALAGGGDTEKGSSGEPHTTTQGPGINRSRSAACILL